MRRSVLATRAGVRDGIGAAEGSLIGAPPGDGVSTHNLLVISDLHLGEDIRPLDTDGDPRVRALDEALAGFLEHYAEHRRDGRPWRLVVNGDMVDFIAVCLMPHQVDLVHGLHPDDHTYGLGDRAHAAAAKMRRVVQRHDRVFRALARFVGQGHDLALVVGNHDAEFHWHEVQALLRETLAAMWAEADLSRRPGARRPEQVAAAVSFHPWFYLEEGVAWIEHGHQYDPYCSFDDVLSPSIDQRDLDPNVGTAILRYVAVHFTRDPSAFWDASAAGYVAWWARQGFFRGAAILASYRDMVLRLVGHWRQRRPEVVARRRERARARLRALAAAARLPEDLLEELRRLHRRPVVADLRRLVRAIQLDRLVLLLITPVLLASALLALLWSAWPAVLSVALLLPLVRLAVEEREPVDPRAAMRKVSSIIRQRVRVPLVVFGHSHDPVAEEGEGGWYFNTGAWMPHDLDRGLRRAFTHLVLERTEAGVRAGLCQWRDGASRSFAERVAIVRAPQG